MLRGIAGDGGLLRQLEGGRQSVLLDAHLLELGGLKEHTDYAEAARLNPSSGKNPYINVLLRRPVAQHVVHSRVVLLSLPRTS